MLTVVTKTGIISRLSCNLLNRICPERVVPQLTRHGIYMTGGYVKYNSTCILQRTLPTLLQLPVNNFNPNALSYSTEQENELTTAQYEKICNETLESLSECFEDLIEVAEHLPDADVTYGHGVLTVIFGDPHGTYVINRQIPNKQIWLSSPISGPKRYDFINGQWIYRRDGKRLHELLNSEISTIVKTEACFDKCSFSGREK